MDSIRVNRSELVGKSQNDTAVLESLVRANALNRTGNVDYNKYGKLDVVGFEKVSENFIDNFIFLVLVPDYNLTKNRQNIHLGSQNRKIRELLKANGIEKPDVKGLGLQEVLIPRKGMLENMPDGNKNKEAKKYYVQILKIAYPNIEYNIVMNFLRNVDYNGYGFFLKDFDVTIDYAGSFNKYKVIDYLTTFRDFREAGSFKTGEEYPRTIVDNDKEVGKNCLSWIEDVDGIKTRQKIYNKMVQMLETKSVRSNVGSH